MDNGEDHLLALRGVSFFGRRFDPIAPLAISNGYQSIHSCSVIS